jgi:hypothetical protein
MTQNGDNLVHDVDAVDEVRADSSAQEVRSNFASTLIPRPATGSLRLPSIPEDAAEAAAKRIAQRHGGVDQSVEAKKKPRVQKSASGNKPPSESSSRPSPNVSSHEGHAQEVGEVSDSHRPRCPFDESLIMPAPGDDVPYSERTYLIIPDYISKQLYEYTHQNRCSEAYVFLLALRQFKAGGKPVFYVRPEDCIPDRRRIKRRMVAVRA